jgi:hypothetical protein
LKKKTKDVGKNLERNNGNKILKSLKRTKTNLMASAERHQVHKRKKS